jgi:glycosyltransferase involved in cell wall biosynthesis
VRLAVYVDDVYRSYEEALSVDLAFPLFVAGLSAELEAVTLLGRLDGRPGRGHHLLPQDVGFVALPYYRDLSRPLEVARGLGTALRRFWRALDEVDATWLLGPHPLALAAAALAMVRRRRVILGVRQDTRAYATHRHPGRRSIRVMFGFLEHLWRLLARVCPVVVVGPALASLYERAPRVLELSVSLIEEADIVAPGVAAQRDYRGETRILSVGRLDPEKNPLLLADVLHELTAKGRDTRLVVCGAGSQEARLRDRLVALGVADRAELLGYVPFERGLQRLYRSSHALLHVSWTEGVPQVLFEAFAARLPVVATDVGGVASAVGDAALLVPAGNANEAARAIGRVLDDAVLRRRLIAAGVNRAHAHTRQSELQRLARWLEAVTPR